MSNFHEYKNISSRWWSPAFYTAKCGYRLQLVVDPDGSDSGKGTHISAGVFLTKGEDDLSLDWPLKIDVTIKLLNWREDNRHVETIIPFNDSTTFDCRNRITEDTIAPNGMFEHQLISHADLQYNSDKNTEYLHHDSLCFQVSLPEGNLIQKLKIITHVIISFFILHYLNIKIKRDRSKSYLHFSCSMSTCQF